MLWLIEYENAYWCSGQLNVVVEAETEAQARFMAGDFMDETQRELFQDEIAEAFEEDPDFDDSCMAVVNSVELFDENHEQWKFFKNPSQSEFYPVIVAR